MEKWGTAARLIGVGFYISACIVGGVLGGLWLDRKLDSEPVFVLLGLVLGLVAAFWGVYQMLIPFMKEYKSDKKPDNKRERR
jgi:ATP synthase protein I